MNEPRRRVPSELLRRGYSDEEVGCLYELSRFFLENGDPKRAETILNGLVEVIPEYAPAWLALSYVRILESDIDGAIRTTQQALRINPNFVEAILYLVTCYLATGDLSGAGTYLGEVGEKIESGQVDNQNIVRFYKLQLVRFQTLQRS